MSFRLAPLPYKYDALSPYISERTMRLHHDAHMRAYIDKLNKLVAGRPQIPLRTLIVDGSGPLFDNAAQVWNHAFFFSGLAKDVKMPPALTSLVVRDWGSVSDLRKTVLDGASSVFGSGWVWLAVAEGRILVHTSKDGDNPVAHGGKPVLAIDVWEHAYYLDYANKREDYVGKLFDHCVDWNRVARLCGIPA